MLNFGPHFITAIFYLNISTILMLVLSFLHFTPPQKLIELIGPYLSDQGIDWLIEVLPKAKMIIALFAIFVFSCAVDHFLHGMVPFIAEIETGVTFITAMVCNWLYYKWKS